MPTPPHSISTDMLTVFLFFISDCILVGGVWGADAKPPQHHHSFLSLCGLKAHFSVCITVAGLISQDSSCQLRDLLHPSVIPTVQLLSCAVLFCVTRHNWQCARQVMKVFRRVVSLPATQFILHSLLLHRMWFIFSCVLETEALWNNLSM